MSAFLPFLVVNESRDQVEAWVKGKLAGADFRVVPTFDLQVARSAHPDCPCPHHGTDECNCQMVILLVYRKQGAPATLLIHGQDGRSWVSFASPTGKRANQHLEATIRHVLILQVPKISTPVEITYENRSAI